METMMMTVEQRLGNRAGSQTDVLTCFLAMTGDLTGLMGEPDTLVEGETDLRRHGVKVSSPSVNPNGLKV